MSNLAFADRTILITGGSRGIGRAASLRLAGEGARVAVNYVSNETKAAVTVAEIVSTGGIAVAVQGNVAIPEEAISIVARTRDAFGPIDMLVHSAGISIVEPATDITWKTWRKTMDVNLDGCKRRREIVAVGGLKVQRPAYRNYSLERGWQLTARGLFITSTLHRSRLSESSVFVASHHEVGSSGRRLRGCDSGVSVGPASLP